MASSFKSPSAPRVINLAVNSDGTWKVISDLSPVEVYDRLNTAMRSISDYVNRVDAGDIDETDNDDQDDTSD